MGNKIVSTAYAPLQQPYQIIMYGEDVAMQIGTLIVTTQKETEEENGYQIETHSHPVVAYDDKNRKGLSDKQLSSNHFLEGAVWNNVEVRDVTSVCLAGATLSWQDFLEVLEHECEIRFYKTPPPIGIYWKLVNLGIKVLPPEELSSKIQLYISMFLRYADSWPLCSDVSTGLYLNVEAIKSPEFHPVNVDNEEIYQSLSKQLLEYRLIIPHAFSYIRANYFKVEYTTEIEAYQDIVKRLNDKESNTNISYRPY
ncbi:MAG: hypothetical protein IKP48_08455 [Bacteroidaceae bacterium]|nr:hypothetical protein [Bacteroidaceae bacterium]